MTSKEAAVLAKKERDTHFWKIVSRDNSATITVEEAACALQVPASALRCGLEDGTLSAIGFMHRGTRKNNRYCVILRSKLIDWYTNG
jgi:hypothetical protein